MASSRQIAANRANATQSTGPKTRIGRTASATNARTHGLTVFQPDTNAVETFVSIITTEQFEGQKMALSVEGLSLAHTLAEAEFRLIRVRALQMALETDLGLEGAADQPLDAVPNPPAQSATLARWVLCLRYRAEAESARRTALRAWITYLRDRR